MQACTVKFVSCRHLVDFLAESAKYSEDGRWGLASLHNFFFLVDFVQYSRRDNPEAGYPEEFSCISLLVRDPQMTTIVQYDCIFFTLVEKQPSRKNV